MSGGPESDPFTMTPQLDQQMRVPYSGDDTYRTASAPPPPPFQPVAREGVNLNSGEQKRRRGRPRKYGTDGSMAMVMAPGPGPGPQTTENLSPPPSTEAAKKPRGRPPGSTNKKKQIEAIGSNGIGFIPHVINVAAGEDVSSKVVAFSQNGPRAVCILSATGAISNVTLSLNAQTGGTATYEGRFDILSLSGSFMVSDDGDHKRRTGNLSTTLAGPEGRVFGGCVSGLFVAHSAVQVIVGSFLADVQKEPKSASHMEPLSGPPKLNLGGTSSSPSQGTTFSESSGGAASPHNLSSGACNIQPHAMSGMPWK